MKSIVILTLSLALPAAAQILATFEIVETATGNPVGNVVVELQYDKTPQTVANFIGLAEGTRSSYESATGAVKLKKFYAGESFYRVVDNPGFKIAQTGSGNGTNVGGGPGYMFRDEFLLPTLKHDPYVLAMANGGPNTNGSEIYLTGSEAIPSLDGKHTVFGIVTDTASQGVIDAIIAAGEDGTTIADVTIQRNGVAFDEFAQGLPTFSGVPGKLSLVDLGGDFPSVSYTPAINVTGDSLFRVFKSTDLNTWNFIAQLPPGYPLISGDPFGLDMAQDPKAFYNISLLRNPDALRQEFLAGRTMDLVFPGGAIHTLSFGSDGVFGIMEISSIPGSSIAFQILDHSPDAYGATLIISPFPDPILRIVAGYDTQSDIEIAGRHSTSELDGEEWIPVGSGTLTLSK